MQSALSIGWIGFMFCMIGVFVGVVLARIIYTVSNKSLSIIFSLCAGMIFAILFLDVLLHSFHVGGGWSHLAGSLTALIFYTYIHKASHRIIIINISSTKESFLFTSLILTISIALHNFPIGMALGAQTHTELSFALLKALILHNIPEGMAVAIPLFMSGLSFPSVFFLSVMISVPVGIGAFIGNIIGFGSSVVVGIMTGFAVGIILLVTAHEIFWKALKMGNTLLSIFCLCLGFSLIYLYHLLL